MKKYSSCCLIVSFDYFCKFSVIFQTRPTPAHLTSVQAEQILAIACENESLNAKRMRIGLEPITHAIPAPGSAVVAAAAVAANISCSSSVGAASTSSTFTSNSAIECATTGPATVLTFPGSSAFSLSQPNSDTTENLPLSSAAAVAAAVAASTNTGSSINSARSSPLALGSHTNVANIDMKSISNGNVSNSAASSLTQSSPLYRPSDFTSPTTPSNFVAAAAAAVANRTSNYPVYFPRLGNQNNGMKISKFLSEFLPIKSLLSTWFAFSNGYGFINETLHSQYRQYVHNQFKSQYGQ